MPTNEDPIVIPIEADFAGFDVAMNSLEASSKRFSRSFTTAMKSMISDGASFEDTLKSLALRMSNIALQSSLKPLENGISNALQSVVSSVGTSLTSSTGSSFSIAKFMDPVVSSLTTLSSGSTFARGSASGGTVTQKLSQPVSTNVTFNISTPNAESFKKSQTQISTMLARSVSRSRRGS